MPKITNPEYKQVVQSKELELRPLPALQAWIDCIPTVKKPRKATETHCKTLLILLYYGGPRPEELAELKPKDIEHVTLPKKGDSPARKAYRVCFKTLKKGKPLRYLHLPCTKYTRFAYQSIKKQHPEQPYFYAFIPRKGASKNTVKWKTKHKIFIRREDGALEPQEVSETKERIYFRKSGKINQYITALTGLPPYFFRHHRQTWLDEKGASLQEQADWKGGSLRSASIYRSMTGEKKKKQLSYF
jgi:hypothetical protein